MRLFYEKEPTSVHSVSQNSRTAGFVMFIGLISAALSCLVYPPRGSSAGSFPEQRLVIEPIMFTAYVQGSAVNYEGITVSN